MNDQRPFDFNPHRKNATKTYTDMAHYLRKREKIQRDDDVDTRKVRWFSFTIGASRQEECWQDKYRDDKALEMLIESKDKRWVLKGYQVPTFKGSHANFTVLTHMAIFHTKLTNGILVVNPATGEEGSYYTLLTPGKAK